MSRRSEDGRVLDDDLLGALAGAVPPVELSTERRRKMRDRVMSAAKADSPPPGTETIRADKLAWREAYPKVWIKILARDPANDFQVSLLKFDAGGCIPGHLHRKDEECYVLEGEMLMGDHLVRAGDFHLARAGYRHPDIVSRGGALVMIRSQTY